MSRPPTLLACPRAVREILLREVARLQSACHEPVAATVKDSAGRVLSITHLRPWAITWWLHPVDWELRVLRIETINP